MCEMDPPASKMRFDSPAFRVHEDGRVERFFGTDTTDPGFDAATGVTSKDVVLDAATGVFARLYLPALPDGADRGRERLPILVYFHGGGLVLGSAASQMYHGYLNSVVSRAGVLAVSVDYRLAPEHPIPAAYEDSWLALSWAASRVGDPWLSEHGDAGRIFLAGDSGGANIVHNMAIKAGTRSTDHDGLPAGAVVERALLLHPMFGGKEPVDGEAADTRYHMEKLWALICPDGDGLGVDDPRLNPMAPGAPSLRALAGRRLLVCSAERDFARARAAAYYQAVKGSGWPGTAEWLESPGEEHGFFLLQPERDESSALMDRVVAFLSGE
ncbi:hypothetical protein CFC21_081693 [Triticum aestivum]|uniref:Alpha/beta hydrolase fold-3 domain-containing protein n=2 Tax=Triticum aestivum TaxID=4565 RepID=A0A3B6NJI7_WHEAT|nr:2-hydroxyisoflavanone dehydratase-like [Triticum aestivum]KAF7077108.1 hypothetical protein CFC21_081693 [Triticum aestivum]